VLTLCTSIAGDPDSATATQNEKGNDNRHREGGLSLFYFKETVYTAVERFGIPTICVIGAATGRRVQRNRAAEIGGGVKAIVKDAVGASFGDAAVAGAFVEIGCCFRHQSQ